MALGKVQWNAKEGNGRGKDKHQTPKQLQNSVPKKPQLLLELSSATLFSTRQKSLAMKKSHRNQPGWTEFTEKRLKGTKKRKKIMRQAASHQSYSIYE